MNLTSYKIDLRVRLKQSAYFMTNSNEVIDCRPEPMEDERTHLGAEDVSTVVDKDPTHPPAGHKPALGQTATGQDGHVTAQRRQGGVCASWENLGRSGQARRWRWVYVAAQSGTLGCRKHFSTPQLGG